MQLQVPPGTSVCMPYLQHVLCTFATQQPLVLQAVGSMLFCALDITLTGVLMAERDLPFIAKTMACNMFVLAGYFAVARANRCQRGGLWTGGMLFFFVRMMQSSTRVWLLLFRGKKKAPAAEGSVIESVPERSGLIAQTENEDV